MEQEVLHAQWVIYAYVAKMGSREGVGCMSMAIYIYVYHTSGRFSLWSLWLYQLLLVCIYISTDRYPGPHIPKRLLPCRKLWSFPNIRHAFWGVPTSLYFGVYVGTHLLMETALTRSPKLQQSLNLGFSSFEEGLRLLMNKNIYTCGNPAFVGFRVQRYFLNNVKSHGKAHGT